MQISQCRPVCKVAFITDEVFRKLKKNLTFYSVSGYQFLKKISLKLFLDRWASKG